MPETDHYDVVIIGSGQSGGPLSTALVQAGRTVALVERKYIGGTCINTGCTPTKTMIASGRVAYLARRGSDYGIHTGDVSVDTKRVRERKRDIVDSFRSGSERRIKEGGTTIVWGDACFVDPHTIEVRAGDDATRTLTAETFVINAGCRPAIPPVPGLNTVPSLDSTTVMELGEVPEHLVILGGGYIGLEFGQLYRRLGARVTIIEHSARFLPREDADIAYCMAQMLREDGIDLLLGATANRVESRAGRIAVDLTTPEGERVLEGSHLLVAVGRTPNTEGLNAAAAGIELTDHGFIKVDDHLHTAAPHIYAMGDAAGSPQFTHMSYDDFRVVRDCLLGDGSRNTRDRLVPYVVFTDPQLGRVGPTEEQLRHEGRNIKVGSMSMSHSARALEVDEARGMIKAVVDAESGLILGASVLGLEGGEIMAMLEIAIMGKLHYTALRDGIWAHPTLSEMLNNLFASM